MKKIVRLFFIFILLVGCGSGGGGGTVGNQAGNVGDSSITVTLGAPRPVDYQKENLVPNLEWQFMALQHHGDSLAFRRGVGDKPKTCKHYQGMERSKGYGTPYLFFVRSGIRTIGCPDDPDTPGELLVVKMGSRNDIGERFQSNRLQRRMNLEDFAPPANDIGVARFHFGIYQDSGGNVWPRYLHPGGMQLIDDVLVVPLEQYCRQPFVITSTDNEEDWFCPLVPDPISGLMLPDIEQKGALAFIDVRDPLDPKMIAYKEFPQLSSGLGVVAGAYISPVTLPGGGVKKLYLFALTWGGSEVLSFATAIVDDLRNITAEDITLLPYYQWWVEDYLGDFKGRWRPWQTLQFIRNDDPANPNDFYLAGGEKAAGSTGKDWIALFKIHVNKIFDGNIRDAIEFKYEKHMRLGEPDMGSLDAGATFYVSPTGQLILYTVSHNDRDTVDGLGNHVSSVEMGEFRNIMVSHAGTCGPQWRRGLPSYHLGGPYNIQEGERLTLDGRLYFIEPWVHLFEDTLVSYYDLFYMNLSGLGLMMDWGNQFSDNYNDLNNFKFTDADFKDRADAFIFCGTTDSILFLSTEPYFQPPRPDYPYHSPDMVPFTARAGTGSVLVEPDLISYNGSDRHDDVESAYIYWQKPSGSEYVWGLSGDALGTIIQTDLPHVVEYQAACGTYTDTVYMKYFNREEWKAETQITVEDTTPPKIDRLTTTPNVLWPPNHELVPVSVNVSASDDCGGPVTCQIVSVKSNEVENGIGDGDKAPDWVISGDLALKLRAERSGTGDGRIYTMTVNCADSSGNNTSGDVMVSVPHDKGKEK